MSDGWVIQNVVSLSQQSKQFDHAGVCGFSIFSGADVMYDGCFVLELNIRYRESVNDSE